MHTPAHTQKVAIVVLVICVLCGMAHPLRYAHLVLWIMLDQSIREAFRAWTIGIGNAHCCSDRLL